MTGRLLGVLGGMGLQATEHFCRMVAGLQDVEAEQEYMDMLVYFKQSIPDRSAYILGKSPVSPIDALMQAAQTLENAGATSIAMPCVTAHYFYDELAAAVSVPFLNVLQETASHAASKGYRKIGLLATTGTLAGGFFTKVFTDFGINVVTPSPEEQAALMNLIYEVKQGKDLTASALDNHSASLRSKGAETVVLGCSELSVFIKEGEGYTDVMQVLAKKALVT